MEEYSHMTPKLLTRYILREISGLATMAAALFVAAGRLDWWQGWAALAVMAGWIIATAVIILRTNPGLLAERLGPRKGAKRWDVVIMSLLGLLQLARYVIAGLDRRYGWTGELPLAAQIAALAVCAAGYALVVWATRVNAFFSQIVRLQPERGQTVVTSGPYAFVRHPTYIGGILYELAAAVLLGSWPALAVGVVTSALLVTRTVLEDRALKVELAGYTAYANKVRYRLVPKIW